MTKSRDKQPARPRLALRVGVTGARSLRADQVPRIHAELESVLERAKVDMLHLSRQKEIIPFYEKDEAGALDPLMYMISPLARGSDRLAARMALKHHYKLCVPLPFVQHEYELDFTRCQDRKPEEVPLTPEEDLREFRQLLAEADSKMTLDGVRAEPPCGEADAYAEQAYEVTGRFVVRHCDLLIAVWDGKSGNGRGGTADIVRYATSAGVPVWWIHATEQQAPRWLKDLLDLRDEELQEQPAHTRLAGHLNLLIPPPPHEPHDHQDWIRRFVSLFKKRHVSQITVYFQEKKRRNFILWRTNDFAMSCATRSNEFLNRRLPWARKERSSALKVGFEGIRPGASHHSADEGRFKDPPCGPDPWPDEQNTSYWHNLYIPADSRANEYAARYRSSYILVIVMATLALISGAIAYSPFVRGDEPAETKTAATAEKTEPGSRTTPPAAPLGTIITAAAELSTLLMVLGLVALTSLCAWHEKSIDYRLLAELFRKQEALAALGWQLPIGNLQHLSDTERLSWVTWLFAAMQRAAPLPQGSLACRKHRVASQAVLLALVDDQINYHSSREKRSQEAGATFENLGSAIFLAVLICVGIKIGAEYEHWSKDLISILGLMAIILPGISAAFVGIRSYAELQLLAEQSRHMLHDLMRARKRVERLKLYRPSVSQDLGSEGLAVALLMLQDLEGWGRLFRGKSMEAA
jgi:hypothetical protein